VAGEKTSRRPRVTRSGPRFVASFVKTTDSLTSWYAAWLDRRMSCSARTEGIETSFKGHEWLRLFDPAGSARAQGGETCSRVRAKPHFPADD
jgi:hypothetical protein